MYSGQGSQMWASQNSAMPKFPELKSGGKERAGSCRRMTSHWNPMKSNFCFFATFKSSKYTVYVVDLSIWEFSLLVPDAWENPTCSRRCWCHCGSGRTSRCSAVWGCWHDVAFVGMQDIWSLHMNHMNLHGTFVFERLFKVCFRVWRSHTKSHSWSSECASSFKGETHAAFGKEYRRGKHR